MERRESPGHLMIYGVEGPRLRLFVREGWSVVQDGDTFPVAPREIASLGLDGGGVMEERVVLTGSMIIDGDIDVSKAFTFLYDRGLELEAISFEYLTQSAQLADFDIEEPVGDQLEEEPTAATDLVQDPSLDLEPAQVRAILIQIGYPYHLEIRIIECWDIVTLKAAGLQRTKYIKPVSLTL